MYLGFKITSFLKFLVKAKPLAGYGIHSPFVFNFTTNVLSTANEKNIALNEIVNLKMHLKSDKRLLEINDFGASTGRSKIQKISQVAKHASVKNKYCRLLYRVTKEIQPKSIIELGTSLGISTIALSLAVPDCIVYTIEGSDTLAKAAEENFKTLGLKNIIQYIGKFDEQLDTILKDIKFPALIFIDGNHKYLPTLKYFKTFADVINEESIVIIDDIHWSPEMNRAWNEICNYPSATIKLDLFQMGIVFFKKGLPRLVYNILF